MQKLSAAGLGALRWTRTGEAHSYQLKSGDDTVATLHWPNPVGTLATAEAEEVRWTLKRGGFLSPMVSVRDAGTGHDVAVLHVHLNTSLLQVSGGATYRWSRTGFWVPAWEMRDANGVELVNFEPVREEARLQGGLVEVSPLGRASPDLLLFLVIGWYFIVQSWIEDEAVAASKALLNATTG